MILKIADLNEAKYNPRQPIEPGSDAFESLRRSIERFGMAIPIVVNKRGNVIVGGHQRCRVLSVMGYTEVEAVIVDLDETAEKDLNIRLNTIDGDWNADKLAAILAEIDTDLILATGFSDRELDDLLQLAGDYEPDTEAPDIEEPESAWNETGSKEDIPAEAEPEQGAVLELVFRDQAHAIDFARRAGIPESRFGRKYTTYFMGDANGDE